MASNGLLVRAKKGTCRICLRVRSTSVHVVPVGEVHHGFATGHIWECKDSKECQIAAEKRLNSTSPDSFIHQRIKLALTLGRRYHK